MKSLDISKYLEKIISTMNDGLMIIAPDGKVRMVNQAFENLTGFQGTEVVGKPCTLLSCEACEKNRRPDPGGHGALHVLFLTRQRPGTE